MTTSLAIPDVGGTLSNDAEDLAGLNSGVKFLPYVSMVAKTGKMVDKGATPGHFILCQNDKFESFGTCYDAIWINLRMKAMKLVKSKPETINYDKKSLIFQDLQKRADAGKFGDDPAFLWGCEYLQWIPRARNGAGAFATYFASSKTARSAADDINKTSGLVQRDPNDPTKTIRIATQLTLSSKLVPSSKGSYFVPVGVPCPGTVFTVMPNPDELKSVLEAFLSPPADERDPAPAESRPR